MELLATEMEGVPFIRTEWEERRALWAESPIRLSCLGLISLMVCCDSGLTELNSSFSKSIRVGWEG